MSDTTMSGPGSEIGIELHVQYNAEDQQRHATMLGIWIWLWTELLLFGPMFVCALVLRVQHPASVTAASRHLKFWIGAGNTAILIISSLTMSAAIELSRMGWQKPMIRFMHITAALGTLFLGFKGYEYYRDYREHMVPFIHTVPYALAGDPASRLFTDLYFLITALHGLHLTTGVGIVLGLAHMAKAPDYLKHHQNRIPILGLYWHFIDLIWIVVFPILYVLNR